MKVKYYIAAIISLLSLSFVYMPAVYFGSMDIIVLGLYYVSVFWFMIAWFFLLLHVIVCIVFKINKNSNWIHHLTSAFIMFVCYAGFFINHYMYGPLSV